MEKTLISRKDIDIIYVSNFYDIPLAGLCRYKGKVEIFAIHSEWENKNVVYEIIFLTPWQRLRSLLEKKAFEICVGYHQTYTNSKKATYFYLKWPKWFWRAVFHIYYGENPFTKHARTRP